MDESTDRSNTAQLLISIICVDDKFNITEEQACLQSIKGKTRGRIIYNEFSEGLQNLNAPISKLSNITTDRAPNMVGKKTRDFQAFFGTQILITILYFFYIVEFTGTSFINVLLNVV